jgi:hypothetical protein
MRENGVGNRAKSTAKFKTNDKNFTLRMNY